MGEQWSTCTQYPVHKYIYAVPICHQSDLQTLSYRFTNISALYTLSCTLYCACTTLWLAQYEHICSVQQCKILLTTSVCTVPSWSGRCAKKKATVITTLSSASSVSHTRSTTVDHQPGEQRGNHKVFHSFWWFRDDFSSASPLSDTQYIPSGDH